MASRRTNQRPHLGELGGVGLWHDPGAIASGKRQLGKRAYNAAQLLPVFFAQTQRHLPLSTRVRTLRHPSFFFGLVFFLSFLNYFPHISLNI